MVAAAVHEVFSVQTVKKNIQTAIECSKESLNVRLGEDELEQVLSNLMSNAIDAVGEEHGKILIRIAEAANFYHYDVLWFAVITDDYVLKVYEK